MALSPCICIFVFSLEGGGWFDLSRICEDFALGVRLHLNEVSGAMGAPTS